MQLNIVECVEDIPQSIWQAEQPFLQCAFWQALQDHHAIGTGSTWPVRFLLVEAAGQAQAMLPVFIKRHNRGEYVFDHVWADAYARYGLDYYPRLVSSVPFTPVVGTRVWLAEGVALASVWPTLWQGVQQLATQTQASSWHGLFVDDTQRDVLHSSRDLAQRVGCQFLWQDHGYGDFDGFLAQLTAKRRKSIKVERQKVAAQGIRCVWKQGSEITNQDWQQFYACYAMTYQVRGQTPYLNLGFFQQIGQTMPEALALVQAIDAQGQGVASALFFQDQQTLYGRYWGALADVVCLHFEVCYYQGIEYALSRGLRYFDPGTQGEHKLIRGFAPIKTYSLHWLAEPAFMQAIEDFVTREAVHVEQYYQATCAALPFKRG
jgi:uncharacterized protein